jgi:hypothetical protein
MVIDNRYGDNCDRSWGDTVLAVIVAGYTCFFIFFAYRLRGVVEGFGIKNELKVTSAIGLAAVIPWLIFNNKAYKNVCLDHYYIILFVRC